MIKKHHFLILNLIGTLSLLSLPFIIYWLYQNSDLYIFSSFCGIILLSKLGHSIGQHRYFSHGSFYTNDLWRKILAILATLSCTGSIIEYAAVHRTHHKYSDTINDPHSPWYQKSFFIWFFQSNLSTTNNISPRIVNDLIKDSFIKKMHQYYWHLIFIYLFILMMIDINLILTMFILPVGYSRLCVGLQGDISHKFGYRNFSTSDKSTNNTLVNIISMGEGSHNNHHYDPSNYNFGFTNNLKEFDLSAIFIKYIIERNIQHREENET